MGPEQSKESKTDLCDQFQDTHFVVNPKCTKNKIEGSKTTEGFAACFPSQDSKPWGNKLASYHVVLCVCFLGRNHVMGVKNPNSFEQYKILSCIFEGKKENHNANPSCRCLEGNLSFFRGMMGGRGNRNTLQILSMTFDSIFLFSTSLGVSSAMHRK